MIMMGMMMGGDGTAGDAHPEIIGRPGVIICRGWRSPSLSSHGGLCHRWGGCPARGIRSGGMAHPLPPIPGRAPSMQRGASAARTSAGRWLHSPDRQGPEGGMDRCCCETIWEMGRRFRRTADCGPVRFWQTTHDQGLADSRVRHTEITPTTERPVRQDHR